MVTKLSTDLKYMNMKTNNDQLDEQNLTPEEEGAIILASGCFVTFLLIVLLIILSIIALLTRGL